MRHFQGMYLPDEEKHFLEWMAKNGEIVNGRGTYQIKKWRACIPWIRHWRTAVDVGAHVGFWAIQMAARFQKVACFEPVHQMRECLAQNLKGCGNVETHAVALGDKDRMVAMVYDPADSGGTHVGQESGPTIMRRLDFFELEFVDFLKIDVEGYEHLVIQGAMETIAKWKPCLIVEQKPHKLGPNFAVYGTPAVDALKEMGAVVRQVISGDYILSWD